MTYVECKHCKLKLWFEQKNEKMIDIFKGQHFFCDGYRHPKHAITLNKNSQFEGCFVKFSSR